MQMEIGYFLFYKSVMSSRFIKFSNGNGYKINWAPSYAVHKLGLTERTDLLADWMNEIKG